jgi:hypothetical protein
MGDRVPQTMGTPAATLRRVREAEILPRRAEISLRRVPRLRPDVR